MGPLAYKFEKKWTYADYLTWDDGQRWEIIDGEAYAMSPAPTLRHQAIIGSIYSRFEHFLRGKSCRPFIAPTDVVFDDENVVQPDMVVVCDPNMLACANIQGAPDLVIEILSPSTNLRDRRLKKALYERFGVKEYLIVDPAAETVDRYLLVDEKYGAPEIFDWSESLTLHLFPELTLNLWEVFEKDLPVQVSPSG
jgi:Uma2 family endonuclease